ncbi:MAG: 6-phosphogluconolactonase [Ktedonobacteraceae bacterium]|nr:6-phosphogluconolactonase [Ktedonobacteraceae bacterium]
MHIAVYPDTDILSCEAAQYIIRIAQESISTHGNFMIALSGGSTPKKLYSLLGDEPYRSQMNWSLVDIFWSDERCVPADNEESNYHMAQQVLLSKIPVTAEQIHRMPADQADGDAASLAYTLDMQRAFATDGIPSFDLIQLGMGPEGHTASLFPHQSALHEQQRLVMPVTVPKPPPARLTFTPRILNAARHVLFLVTGTEKAEALQAVLEGSYQPDEYPAQLLQSARGEVTWMLDEAAASKLGERKEEK